jgi:hypothetical protein
MYIFFRSVVGSRMYSRNAGRKVGKGERKDQEGVNST